MRVPNVSERMKEAPAHALRAVFAGIGQALLLSDRMRRRLRDGEQEPQPAQPATGSPAASASPPAPTGVSAAAAPAATKPAATKPAATKPAATKPTATKPTATKPAPTTKPGPAAKPAATTSAATKPAATKPGATAETTTASAPEPPLPNYDELTVPSLRARMRSLDTRALRDLITYEKAHAARGDVIAMFERRIAKLEEAGS